MFSDVNSHVISRIFSGSIETYPYKFIQVSNIFPQEFYQQMIDNPIPTDCLQTLIELRRVKKNYDTDKPFQRRIVVLEKNMPILPDRIRPLWQFLGSWFASSFKNIILNKFDIKDENYKLETLYTRDFEGYSLGPHTDTPRKIATALFYLPKDDSTKRLGTSIYLPGEADFRCQGGPHYSFNLFHRYRTIDFLPNTMFCFVKTVNSFHGVEPLMKGETRDLMICDIQKT